MSQTQLNHPQRHSAIGLKLNFNELGRSSFSPSPPLSDCFLLELCGVTHPTQSLVCTSNLSRTADRSRLPHHLHSHVRKFSYGLHPWLFRLQLSFEFLVLDIHRRYASSVRAPSNHPEAWHSFSRPSCAADRIAQGHRVVPWKPSHVATSTYSNFIETRFPSHNQVDIHGTLEYHCSRPRLRLHVDETVLSYRWPFCGRQIFQFI